MHWLQIVAFSQMNPTKVQAHTPGMHLCMPVLVEPRCNHSAMHKKALAEAVEFVEKAKPGACGCMVCESPAGWKPNR